MKTRIILFTLVFAAAALGCNKNSVSVAPLADSGQEIIIGVGPVAKVDFETKATAITSVPSSLYWGASTGTPGSETARYACASFSVSEGKIATGKYQTVTPTLYNHYISNLPFTVGANTTMTANNTVDVLAGRIPATTSATPSVELQHIFARTGTINAYAPAGGYAISGVSYKIIGKSAINGTAGTYNLTGGAWTSASTKLTSYTALTTDSDMYLIPGVYTIQISFTLTKGDWSNTFVQTGDVTLVAGKKNNITCQTSIIEEPVPISITITLADWDDNNIDVPVE